MRRLYELWLAAQVVRYLLTLALVGGLIGAVAVSRAITGLNQSAHQEVILNAPLQD